MIKFQCEIEFVIPFSFHLAVTNVGNCTIYPKEDNVNCTIDKDLASYWKRDDGRMPPALKGRCEKDPAPPGIMMYSNSTLAYGC